MVGAEKRHGTTVLCLRTVERITSRRNALVLQYRAAARGDDHVLLLDGVHLVHDALAAGLSFRSALVLEPDDSQELQRIVSALRGRHVQVSPASPEVMAAASPVRSASPIVALAEPPAISSDAPYRAELPLVLVACHVQDPGNLGAFVRVAEAAGATGASAAGSGADPFGWKALRGSMGSAFRLPVSRHETPEAALHEARRHGCRVVAAVPRSGSPLFESGLAGPLAFFIGGEGGGLDRAIVEAADIRITIPMTPPVESLNVAVSAALVAYECRRQRLVAVR